MSTARKRRNPADFIKQLKERPVEVKLNDNTIYKGKLNGLDGTMNVLLSDAKEVVGEEGGEEWKMLLIRGNNIMYIKKDYWLCLGIHYFVYWGLSYLKEMGSPPDFD